jgi:hypothetical protein
MRLGISAKKFDRMKYQLSSKKPLVRNKHGMRTLFDRSVTSYNKKININYMIQKIPRWLQRSFNFLKAEA